MDRLSRVIEFVQPYYMQHDLGHKIDHAEAVEAEAIYMAKRLNISDNDIEMLQVAAYLHDVGLYVGREAHHLEAHKLVLGLNHPALNAFNVAERELLASMCLEHRKSTTPNPSTGLSIILSAADIGKPRLEALIERATRFQPGEVVKVAEVNRHMRQKYGRNGYVKYPSFYKELYSTELSAMWDEIDAL